VNEPNEFWDDLIAAVNWEPGSASAESSSEASLGRYTLVKMFDGDEIWIYEWIDNVPTLRKEVVVHGSLP